MMIQNQDEQSPPAITSEWPELRTHARRRVYSVFAITLSFLMLWIAPLVGGDAMVNYAMLASLAICLWDAPASLFLLIASAGAYFVMPEEGAFKITPTQIVAFGILIRCCVSPGIRGISRFLTSLNGWIKTSLVVFCVGIYGTAMVRLYIPAAIPVTTGLLVFVAAGALAMQMRSQRWIAISIIAGLLLASAYYLLIWTHLLGAVWSGTVSRSGGLERISGGRNDPNYIGTLITPCFSALLLIFLCGPGLLKRALGFILACLCFMACADTGSRAALAGSLAGGIGAMTLAARLRGFRAISGGVLLIVLGGIFGLAAGEMVSGALSQTVARFTEASSRGEWWMAMAWFASHPIADPQGWLASTGTGVYAHQTFIQAGIDGGFPGLIGLSGVAIACVILAWRQIKHVAPAERLWQQVLLLMLMTILIGVCGISVIGHKVLWAILAICGLPAHALDPLARQNPHAYEEMAAQDWACESMAQPWR